MSWPARLFCDTSFFFACLEPRDIHHAQAKEWLEESAHRGTVFVTTWDIVSETITLLRVKSGYKKAAAFIDEVLPALQIARYDDSIRGQAEDVFKRFARDKKLSFCDCVSFAVLTALLDTIPSATFDAHFRSLGLPGVK